MAVEAGDHPIDDVGGVGDERVWEDWDSSDWIEGMGIARMADKGPREAVAAAVEAEAGAGAEVGAEVVYDEAGHIYGWCWGGGSCSGGSNGFWCWA